MTESASKGSVVLLSGGVDSATLIHLVAKEMKFEKICALSFSYGQKHVRELEMAVFQARALGVEEHKIVDLSAYYELVGKGSILTDVSRPVLPLSSIPDKDRDQPPTYVPNRNMVMLSLAAAWAETLGFSDVFYGAQHQDHYGYWDCTERFIAGLNDVLSLNRRTPIRIRAPFAGMTKSDVIKKGLALGVDYSHTWSCYRGGKSPCGVCPSCVERSAAFRNAGIADPVV